MLTLALATGVFIAAMFLGEGVPVLGIFLVGIIFLVFYIASPRMIFLEKSKEEIQHSWIKKKILKLNIWKRKQEERKVKKEKEKIEKEKQQKANSKDETKTEKTIKEFEDIFSSDEN